MQSWLLLPLMVLGCATPLQTNSTPSTAEGESQPSSWQVDEDTNVLVHVPSGYQFPDDYPNCKRTDPRVYDRGGENVSVGYLCRELGAVIDVYVYPKRKEGRRALTNHFKQLLSTAISANDAELRVTRAGTLGVGDDKFLGYAGLLTWKHDGGDVGSHVLLFEAPHDRYVKVRATATFSDSTAELVPPLLVSKTILHRLGGAELTPQDLWPDIEPSAQQPQELQEGITLTRL